MSLRIKQIDKSICMELDLYDPRNRGTVNVAEKTWKDSKCVASGEAGFTGLRTYRLKICMVCPQWNEWF